jgi:hypothetical protein
LARCFAARPCSRQEISIVAAPPLVHHVHFECMEYTRRTASPLCHPPRITAATLLLCAPPPPSLYCRSAFLPLLLLPPPPSSSVPLPWPLFGVVCSLLRAHVRPSVESLLQCSYDRSQAEYQLSRHARPPCNRILPPMVPCTLLLPSQHIRPPATFTMTLQPWPSSMRLHASPPVGLPSDAMHSFKAHPQSRLHHDFLSSFSAFYPNPIITARHLWHGTILHHMQDRIRYAVSSVQVYITRHVCSPSHVT